MCSRHFRQIDVFTAIPCRGNPVAVVHDAEDLTDAEMAAFARWTNLSETTFLLPARNPAADYRLRIFAGPRELPFAGHPTLGSAHAWLEAGGQPAAPGRVVQECGAGLIAIRCAGAHYAFAAPPLLRSGPIEAALAARVVRGLGIDSSRVRGMAWVDNGPGWIGVLVDGADTVRGIAIDRAVLHGLDVGVIGPCTAGDPVAYEVRAFFTADDVIEDPVTGSLNASLAQWLIGNGTAPARYRVRQGTALGRDGVVDIEQIDHTIWVGGDCITCIEGVLHL